MDFPQYRISKNGQNLYRIESVSSFTELQYIGKRVQVFHVLAESYPEKVRIQDLLTMSNGHCEIMDAEKFEAILQNLG